MRDTNADRRKDGGDADKNDVASTEHRNWDTNPMSPQLQSLITASPERQTISKLMQMVNSDSNNQLSHPPKAQRIGAAILMGPDHEPSYRKLPSPDAYDLDEDDDEEAGAIVPANSAIESENQPEHRHRIQCVPLGPRSQFRVIDPVPTAQNPKTILIVDDTQVIRSMLSKSFARFGFNVETAPDGKFAFSMMQNKLYDLVFLDIEMPVMNGYRCTQYIRQWEQQMQRCDRQLICGLSSHNTPHEIQLAEKCGMDDFQAKPTPVKELLQFMNELFKQTPTGKFAVGDQVEADEGGASRLQFEATITRVNQNGTYDVAYADGSKEAAVRESRIRRPAPDGEDSSPCISLHAQGIVQNPDQGEVVPTGL